jgi:histidinol-phosphate aminotransferase
MAAYVPGEQPRPSELGRLVKLNTNENPYPPSPRVAAAVRSALGGGRLRIYPDPAQKRLRELAGKAYGFRPECVLGANGSDELIALLVRAFVPEGGAVMTMSPTYLVYATAAAGAGARLIEVPFTHDWRLPAGLSGRRAQVFFLANPNSPTGTAVPPEQVAAFARRFRGLVVVDEAYADFASANCLELARRLPNVVVTRTMSKSFSLAGLRLGVLLGHPDVVAALMKLKDSYNLGALQLAAAEAALSDMAHLRRNARRIVATRRRLVRELAGRDFCVLPSEANFVLMHLGPKLSKRLGGGPGAVRALRACGVLVRHYPGRGLEDALRITVGTDREADKFLAALDRVSR